MLSPWKYTIDFGDTQEVVPPNITRHEKTRIIDNFFNCMVRMVINSVEKNFIVGLWYCFSADLHLVDKCKSTGRYLCCYQKLLGFCIV